MQILVDTLLGTAATFYAIHNLVVPIPLTFLPQHQYLKSRQLPNLPAKFTDKLSIFMTNTYHILTKIDEFIENLANFDKLTNLFLLLEKLV